MRQRLIERALGGQNTELLAAVAIRRAAALDRREAGGDELQHLVADMVTVGVVEQLEMIHVDHRDRIRRSQPREALLERAAAGQIRQFVAEGEAGGVPPARPPPANPPPRPTPPPTRTPPPPTHRV